MCTNVTRRARIAGSAKGADGWFAVDTATVYFDHPFHAPDDHTLNIDLVNEANGAPARVAIELSAASARELVRQIEAVLGVTETPLAGASGVIGSNQEEGGAQAGT